MEKWEYLRLRLARDPCTPNGSCSKRLYIRFGGKELCVSVIHCIHQWLYILFWGALAAFFTFVILYKVGRTPWTGDQHVASPLSTHRTEQTQNKRTQTSMPRVGFEPMTPVLEGAKTSCFRPRDHRDRRYVSHGRACLWRATDECPLEVSCTYQIKFLSSILLT
jgi:hypothetical protein